MSLRIYRSGRRTKAAKATLFCALLCRLRVRAFRVGAFWAISAISALAGNPAFAAERAERAERTEKAAGEQTPHHLSLFIGDTQVLVNNESNEDAFTLGIDYEYRLNRLLGVGGVAEYAFGPVDATTLLAAVDIHIARGLAVQAGTGVEFVEGRSNFWGVSACFMSSSLGQQRCHRSCITM